MRARPSNSYAVLAMSAAFTGTSVTCGRRDTYRVTVIYTTVNDICAYTFASAVVVDILGVTPASVRNTRQPPSGTVLLSDSRSRHHLIRLDVVNLRQETSTPGNNINAKSAVNSKSTNIRMISQSFQARFVKARGKSLEQVVVNMVSITREQVHDVAEK